MKNENTKTEAERIAKAFNQLANAIGNLCKAVRKTEGMRIPKTAPLPNPKGLHESNIDQRIKEWVEAIEIWKNNLINKNSKTKPEPNDPLAGMHVDENNYPDYVCIKDYVFVNGRVKKGSVFKYELDITKDKKRYVYHEDTHSSYSCDAEEIKKLTEHFKKVETVETFDENKRFNDYICVKDFRDLKVGDVLKFDRADSLLHEYIFICQQANDGLVLMNIDMIQKNPSHFVEYNKTVKSEYAFKMQKNDGYYANQKLVDQDKIEFHDKDGFAWFVITKSNKFWQDFAKKKAEEIKPFEIKKNADGTFYFEIDFKKKETPLADLQKEVEIEKQCEELINHFMPLITKWKFEGNKIINQEETYSGVWSYSDNNKRKAAIKVAIRHCELKAMFIPISSMTQNELVISQLKKMLSQ